MSRRTSVRLLVSGIALVLLFAVLWAASSVRSRGSSYYFPQWQIAGSPLEDTELEARWAGVTNLTDGLAIVLPVLERGPSRLGVKWQELHDKLPGRVSDHLPQYLGPRTDEACEWLAQMGDEPAVAQAVAERWPRWSPEVQTIWAGAQADRLVSSRPEYLPLLQSAILSSNTNLSPAAAMLLASYRPVSETNALLLATWMTNGASVTWVDRAISSRLASRGPLPSVLIAALTHWLNAPDPWRSAQGALVLARVAPDEFPGETLLPARLLALSPMASGAVMLQLKQPVFRPVATSAWSIGFWGQRLSDTNAVAARAVFPPATVAELLGQLGPAAAPAVPALMPLLASTNRNLAKAATRALVSVAPLSPELVALLSAQLTNEAVAGEILLWLASAGTNALPAQAAVSKIANDEVQYLRLPFNSTPRFVMDPVLARRYGLTQPLVPAGTAATSPLPSKIMVRPELVQPKSLLAWWPPSPPIRSVQLTDIPESVTDSGPLEPSTFRGPMSLAELARYCLQQMQPSSAPAQ